MNCPDDNSMLTSLVYHIYVFQIFVLYSIKNLFHLRIN